MTVGAVSLGTAASAPLVALLGVRGALFAAGMAAIVAAGAAVALGLHHIRGESAPRPTSAEADSLAPGIRS